ncbi:hypothetical protein [Acaryochloris marina]|uniref:PD-(D/E)XK nuclease domain-containing protein n=1 Tax=Acaryochloris marina TaxID=155978 RepID=UPI001BB0D629|nr:hypothetical protein [Acaryochloris marina]QUY41224.1 transposase [Acaryochloris marina S15]
MPSVHISTAVCAVVAEVFENAGSHATLDALFKAVGAPGDPPEGAHHAKWKTWLVRMANDPEVDALKIFGNLLSEFMDLQPKESEELDTWRAKRERIVTVLEENGFRYYRGGRVLPVGEIPPSETSGTQVPAINTSSTVEETLQVLVRGLPRAMYPLSHRRINAQSLTFNSEYDIQDLLHSLMRPWVADIRPEEFTPSYGGSSTRMDFLLPAYRLVIETKRVRDKAHAGRVGDELIIDIEHYRRHSDCERLWCVIYDPSQLIQNPAGLIADLEGERYTPDGSVIVRVFVLGG